jgi:hypothetical protein
MFTGGMFAGPTTTSASRIEPGMGTGLIQAACPTIASHPFTAVPGFPAVGGLDLLVAVVLARAAACILLQRIATYIKRARGKYSCLYRFFKEKHPEPATTNNYTNKITNTNSVMGCQQATYGNRIGGYTLPASQIGGYSNWLVVMLVGIGRLYHKKR